MNSARSLRLLGAGLVSIASMAIGCSTSPNTSTSTANTASAAASSASTTGANGGTSGSVTAAGGTNGNTAGSNGGSTGNGTGTSAGTTGTAASTTGTTGTTASAQCPNPVFEVVFSPMFSASIPGDSTQLFQIPAIVTGVDQTTLSWTASDLTKVSLSADPINGGTMITTLAPGEVTIIAYVTSSPTVCGASVLTITPNTLPDWQLGYERYNLEDAGNQFSALRGDNYVACTNCHGATATEGVLQTIAHTPEQAGGFSDSDLGEIITEGVVPDGGYFDPTIVSYETWHTFHQWYMGDGGEDLPGIICYLRSLTPTPQTGTSNFGGHGPGDGGYYRAPDGGGFNRPDAGGRHGGGPGGMCTICTDNTQCGGGTCINNPSNNGSSYCAPLCSTDTDPDGGLACVVGNCFGLSNGFSGCYPASETCVGYDAGFQGPGGP